MGIEKFLDDAKDVKIANKDYKIKVDNELKNKFEEENEDFKIVTNLLNLEEENKSKGKDQITVYFEKDDLQLLKAISKLKNKTVNKTIMEILQPTLNATRNNLPESFDIDKLAKEYDAKRKKRSAKK